MIDAYVDQTTSHHHEQHCINYFQAQETKATKDKRGEPKFLWTVYTLSCSFDASYSFLGVCFVFDACVYSHVKSVVVRTEKAHWNVTLNVLTSVHPRVWSGAKHRRSRHRFAVHCCHGSCICSQTNINSMQDRRNWIYSIATVYMVHCCCRSMTLLSMHQRIYKRTIDCPTLFIPSSVITPHCIHLIRIHRHFRHHRHHRRRRPHHCR